MMSAAALMDFEAEAERRSPTSTRREHNPTHSPRVETYSYVSPPISRAILAIPTLLPLFTVEAGDAVLHLRQPLLLRVAFEEGEYLVENDALHLFGHGRVLADAIRTLAHDFVYYWRYYASLRSDEVAGDGVKLKRLYESLAVA